jgi:Fe2+ transport system protein B
MKKTVLTIVAMLSMSMAYAEGNNGNEREVNEVNSANYEMSINAKSLNRYLGSNIFQKVAVKGIQKKFSADMKEASSAKIEERKNLVDKAVEKDIKKMRRVLSDDQYSKYLRVLNLTFNNHGLSE